MNREHYTVILFYKFFKITSPEKFRDKQRKIAEAFSLKGRLLVAPEGINGTFEGTTKNIKSYIREVRKQKAFKDVVFKQTTGNGKAFTKLKVKTRPEAITLGVGPLNVKRDTAPMITATQLDKMYDKNEDFVVLDLRNDFEIQAGYFEKTVNPKLQYFRDLPSKIQELSHLKHKKIVAVCTGDIRVEKATAYLKKEGFTNVYQLKDGIFSYMKKYPGKRFKGTLFTFDNRMVTPVVEGGQREVVGRCAYCKNPCEEYYNDDSMRPSRKVICCATCYAKRKNRLRPAVPV